jgi:hypothetical protein
MSSNIPCGDGAGVAVGSLVGCSVGVGLEATADVAGVIVGATEMGIVAVGVARVVGDAGPAPGPRRGPASAPTTTRTIRTTPDAMAIFLLRLHPFRAVTAKVGECGGGA